MEGLAGPSCHVPIGRAARGEDPSAIVLNNLVGAEGEQVFAERTVELLNSLWPFTQPGVHWISRSAGSVLLDGFQELRRLEYQATAKDLGNRASVGDGVEWVRVQQDKVRELARFDRPEAVGLPECPRVV